MASRLFRRPALLCRLAAILAFLGFPLLARGGSDEGGAAAFVRDFLAEYPRFHAEGVMTSSLPGRAPYRCRVEITFDKSRAMLFAYNTDGSKNIIPYDYAYADRTLREKIYNRDRTQLLESTEIGAPTRTLFNFVWDLLAEAEHGAGLRSLLFSGLMIVDRDDLGKVTRITLRRRLPAGPILSVVFTFGDADKLRLIEIAQSDTSTHRIEIRRFRPEDADKPARR